MFKMDTNKDLLYDTGNSAQCYVAAWMGREWGGEWTGICMAELLCCAPETITTLLIGLLKYKIKGLKKCNINNPSQKDLHFSNTI